MSTDPIKDFYDRYEEKINHAKLEELREMAHELLAQKETNEKRNAHYQIVYDGLRHICLEIGRVRHRLRSIEGVNTTHPAFMEQLGAAREEIESAEETAEAHLVEMKKQGAV